MLSGSVTRLLAYRERRRQAELARLTDGRTSARYGPSFYSPANADRVDGNKRGSPN